MIAKVISAICFALSFLVSIVLFTGHGAEFISPKNALIVFLITGGIALALNLASYKTGKHDPKVNFYFWLGSIIVFIVLVGILVFNQMRTMK